ncbi:hypothetical protein J6P04_04190 [bacterium]|nr:hypothetical protein [bacterium]
MRFIMSSIIDDKITSNYTIEVRNMLQKAPIAISDPLLLANSQYHQSMLKKMVNFFNNNQEFNKHCMLVLSNQYDGLVLVDDPN